MNAHLAVPQTSRLQLIGIMAVIISGAAIFGVILWAVLTGRDFTSQRADEAARIQFELTQADICATAGILSLPPTERTTDLVQQIVNECLVQVDLGDLHIEVPVE